MRDSRRRHLTNAAFSSVDLYAEYIAAFVISVIVARQLGPESYGTYTLLLWIASAGIVLSNNGITTGAMKFLGEVRGRWSEELANGLLFRMERGQVLSALGTAVVLALAFLLLPEDLIVDPEGRGLLWVLLPAVVFRSLYVYYFSAAKGFEDFRLAARVKLVVAPLSLLVVVGFALAEVGLAGFVYAYVLGCLLYAGVMRVALFRGRGEPPDPSPLDALGDRIRRHVKYASLIVILDLLILRQTEVFFLGLFSTPEAVGFYGLGRSLASSAVLLIPGVFTALLLPAMSRAFGEDPGVMAPRFLAATRYIVLLAVPVVMACEVFASDLIALLYGSAYGPAALVFRVAVAAGAVGVVSASASSYQLSTDRQPAVVGIMVGTALLTLVLDVLLIGAFELVGAIVAGAVGAVTLGTGLLWHAYHTLGVVPELGAHGRALAAGAVAAVPALGAHFLLPSWLAIPLGTSVLAGVYVGLTILFGAWADGDLRFLEEMADGLPFRLAGPVGGALAWLRGRRPGGVTPEAPPDGPAP